MYSKKSWYYFGNFTLEKRGLWWPKLPMVILRDPTYMDGATAEGDESHQQPNFGKGARTSGEVCR